MSEEFQSNDSEELSSTPQTTSEYFNMLKVMVESLEKDAHKFESGTKAAGVRLRKGLRLVRDEASNFVKFTLGKK